VADLVRATLMAAFWAVLPLMLAGFVAGVAINLLQIVTSIQDPSFSAVPRLVAFLAAVVVCLPWIVGRLVAFTTTLLGDLAKYAQ
jgi:flagellar biosynthetic protein FliQ